jgi:hypothetical protein
MRQHLPPAEHHGMNKTITSIAFAASSIASEHPAQALDEQQDPLPEVKRSVCARIRLWLVPKGQSHVRAIRLRLDCSGIRCRSFRP